MVLQNGVYCRPEPGGKVAFRSTVDLWWETGWGNGPFTVVSARDPLKDVCTCGIEDFKSPHISHHQTCERVSTTEVLTLETPLGSREISGDWFELVS